MKKVIFIVIIVAFLCINAPPAMAELFDLTGTLADTQEINNAWFYNVNAASTGSGSIHSFVRMKDDGKVTPGVEHGYNTDYRKVQYDENTSPIFTRSLLLSMVPIVELTGTDYTYYREFLLDINQDKTGAGRLLSLDQIQIYQAGSGDLTVHDTTTGLLGTLAPIYELDAGADNALLLDYSLNNGSGSGDMFLYIPNDLFVVSDDTKYLYLYSMFGAWNSSEYPNTASYEEWAVQKPVVVPVPGAILLGMLGLTVVGVKLRKFA